jgi:hypothetical protein
MKEPRNPFRLRASEHIESDATFIRLFAPGALDLLPSGSELWDRVHIIRSAPGGGKSSLMRLFTPAALQTLHAYRARDECKELYQRMRTLGVLCDEGPRVLGAMLSCARSYSALADMDFDAARRNRLFFSLLDARIILSVLRAAIVLAKLEYPDDLHRISVDASDTDIPNLKLPASGSAVYEWARDLEARVCEAIDSFGPLRVESLPGHETLWSLKLLRHGAIKLNGQPIADHILIMLDNVQELTGEQREQVLQATIEARSPVAVWIAERFEALNADELLSSGATEGRDYEKVIPLERYWREKGRRFENVLFNIADRRARAAADVEIESFSACLQSSLDGTEWLSSFGKAVETVAGRVKSGVGSDPRFVEWVADRERMDGTPRELALGWRTLEILIERERRRSQQSFDFTLSPDTLSDKDDSAARAGAELFLSREFDIPYYFGASRLASLASANIEQFLAQAGDSFEEVVSAALIKKTSDLTAKRQEIIIRKAADTRWEEIPRRVRNGRDVRNFLEAIGAFSNWATYQPNAPYAPGVTGIAISMADRDKLRDALKRADAPDARRLASALAAAISENLLDPILDYKCKGQRWMVLNLNRLLCVRFHLPLHYGGWKEKTLKELYRWLDQGFRPKTNEILL